MIIFMYFWWSKVDGLLSTKLKLNGDKIEFFIALSPHHIQYYLQNVTFYATDSSIKSVPTIGITFNDGMKGGEHASTACGSVNYHMHNIEKIRKYINYDMSRSC